MRHRCSADEGFAAEHVHSACCRCLDSKVGANAEGFDASVRGLLRGM